MGDLIPREKLIRQGMRGLGGLGGGIGMLVLRIFTGGPGLSLLGLIVGGAVTVFGLTVASSREDRRAGLVVTAAGLLTAAASLPWVGGIGQTLMTLGGIGLLAVGAFNLVKFLVNLRKRM